MYIYKSPAYRQLLPQCLTLFWSNFCDHAGKNHDIVVIQDSRAVTFAWQKVAAWLNLASFTGLHRKEGLLSTACACAKLLDIFSP